MALADLLGGFNELSAGGIEAGRLFESLPSPLKQPTLTMLRMTVKHCAPRR